MRLHFILAAFVCGAISLEKPKPFDFVEDALVKYLNRSVDPCDNFYRHACSFNSPDNLIGAAFEEISAYVEESQKDLFFNQLLVMNDYKLNSFRKEAFKLSNIESMLDFFTDVFESSCTQNYESSGELIAMLVAISQHAFKFYYKDYLKTEARPIGNRDRGNRCQKLTNLVRENLQEAFRKLNYVTKENIFSLRGYTIMMVKVLSAINAHIDFNVQDGIHETGRMVHDIINFEEELIGSTPWLRNQTVKVRFEKIVKRLKMYDDHEHDVENFTDQLTKIEDKYTRCKKKMKNVNNGNLFCYIWTASVTFDVSAIERFSMDDNAYNEHPIIWFGFPDYYHQQYGKEMAAKLGYTGFRVGHEIGHTYFDDNRIKPTLPAFPQKLRDCVQNQYRATCDEYKEKSCSTEDKQLDDNGADIFGLHAAYILLEQHFGDKIESTIDRLGITNEQLFFYSFAFQFCGGAPSTDFYEDGLDSHAAHNVRINAVVQHPGFQNAFKCADNSRMMKSATERCIMYGEGAPEFRRKRKFQGNFKRN